MGCSSTKTTLKDSAEAPLWRYVSINGKATHERANMTALRRTRRFVFEWRSWNAPILRKRYLRWRRRGRVEKRDEVSEDSIHLDRD